MNERDKRGARKLDQVDRRSQVGVSRALRARDASRPNEAQLAEALEKLKSSPLPRPTPSRRKEGEARRSPRNA